MFAERLGRQLRKPTKGLWGWLAKQFFERNNAWLEEAAVGLCRIQPQSQVLELGFGPGLGLRAAADRLPGPGGKLYGLDYSEYMHSVASRRLRTEILAGKVRLFLGSVDRIPLEDSQLDTVYHCNCYYFWPDLSAGSREIHRVMKPGALMVTTFYLKYLESFAASGFLPNTNWKPEQYMEALRAAGFNDVRMEDRQHKGHTFQAIFAIANKP
ncbi:demethylmenaquinone methyltransferase [Callorhinchus milii]|uniref:Putative methyltransferase ydaC-like protein n=1 Tax=Callorhinchus milii TaxID=7868 RepID=V9LAS5_CALMI|nr:demethylmenaquinone methyltransferase [Callorhinchus milii]|eukprot:gi/632953339/ref/XP_007892364.1/ PREDICTED: 24-methylenesterol C-methyltransferase 3-like [Callorhinchus milii]